MNKLQIVMALALVSLVGCKPSENLAAKLAESQSSTTKEPAPVIVSPYTFMINGKKTQVRGVDKCHDELTNESFECIDLSKSFADVYLLLPEGAHKERWSFVKTKDGKYLSLNRPDGTLVIPAKDQ